MYIFLNIKDLTAILLCSRLFLTNPITYLITIFTTNCAPKNILNHMYLYKYKGF